MSLEAEESKNKAIAEYEQKMTLLQSKYKFL